MASSTGDAPPRSPNAPVLGGGDARQQEVMPPGNPGSPGNATPMNPLLLASVCLGAPAALKFFFDGEDKQEPPMMMLTQELINKLVGSSTERTLTVAQASDDLEAGLVQPAALPGEAPDTAEAGADHDTEDSIHQLPALPLAAPEVVEDAVVLPTRPAAARLLKGVTADGDTALHVLASNGDHAQFLECASIIDERDQDLLFVVNGKGDTPLHCAARAGNSKIVSHLIDLAGSRSRMHELLRKENVLKETALHEAIRIGNADIVGCLLKADPSLANYPEQDTSPLYLAILQRKNAIAKVLHDMSNGNLSYHGPHGKNALHAATIRGKGSTKQMLKWNNSLTTHGDGDGSTPLHLASSFKHSSLFKVLLKANPAPVYQADNKGLFPIHVAASVGVEETICIIAKRFPRCAGLRTARGQTFLHVAVEKGRLNIVSYVCQTVSLAWILNMRDNDGNTAMHLAVKSGSLPIFCSLYGNKEVILNSANNNEETPINLSIDLIPRGMHYILSTERCIYWALAFFGNNHIGLRTDLYEERYSRKLKPDDEVREENKAKDFSQILGISSVLIASVAFNATFAVPGGFISDDHTNRGTPILAGRYTFDAFMMANALAFVCSLIATTGLALSGSSIYNLKTRRFNLAISLAFISSSITSLSAAFALGVYMMLAPVALPTAIAVSVLGPLVVLHKYYKIITKLLILARPLYLRLGLICATRCSLRLIMKRTSMDLWPFIIIFGWAAIAHKIRNFG